MPQSRTSPSITTSVATTVPEIRPAGDTYTRFEAVATGYNGDLDLGLVSAAVLVLDAQTPGVEWRGEFGLNLDLSLDRFWYEFDWISISLDGLQFRKERRQTIMKFL